MKKIVPSSYDFGMTPILKKKQQWILRCALNPSHEYPILNDE